MGKQKNGSVSDDTLPFRDVGVCRMLFAAKILNS